MMFKKGLLLFLLPLLAALQACQSPSIMLQQPQAKSAQIRMTPIELPETEENMNYKLGVGDQLSIAIYDQPKSNQVVTIDATGYITYLYIGAVYAEGKTINELKEIIQKKIQEIFVNTFVMVVPIKLENYRVFVYGEVNKPGEVILNGPSSLIDLFSKVGGLKFDTLRGNTVPRYDINKIVLIRNNTIVPVNFKKLLHDGDFTYNIQVQNKDVIFVPEVELNKIYLIGEFQNPQSIT